MGSTRALLNTSGTLTDTYRYDAFGTLRTSTGSTTNVYRFTGQQFDPLTGDYSLRARYYAPNTGRFLSRDTWRIDHQNPLELNRYVYAASNPVRYTDPSGLASIDYGKLLSSVGNGSIKALNFFVRGNAGNAGMFWQMIAQMVSGALLGMVGYMFAVWQCDVDFDGEGLIAASIAGAYVNAWNFVASAGMKAQALEYGLDFSQRFGFGAFLLPFGFSGFSAGAMYDSIKAGYGLFDSGVWNIDEDNVNFTWQSLFEGMMGNAFIAFGHYYNLPGSKGNYGVRTGNNPHPLVDALEPAVAGFLSAGTSGCFSKLYSML